MAVEGAWSRSSLAVSESYRVESCQATVDDEERVKRSEKKGRKSERTMEREEIECVDERREKVRKRISGHQAGRSSND